LRPDNHAHDLAVASSAVAPRGETPSCNDGECRVVWGGRLNLRDATPDELADWDEVAISD